MKSKDPIKVGITGQSGFIGSHLYNHLSFDKKIKLITFKKSYFNSKEKLKTFSKSCDVIVHLAGINRNDDHNFLYSKNIELTQKIIDSCSENTHFPRILFSSSFQVDKDNLYGKSKKKCNQILKDWSNNYGCVTSIKIPNVFGPFCKPEYNSVVATFCDKLIKDEEPKVIIDAELDLIYVNQLVSEISKIIHSPTKKKYFNHTIEPKYKYKVSKILEILSVFKKEYYCEKIIPDIKKQFKLDLFNTFRSYIPASKLHFFYNKNEDNRGMFVELCRANNAGQSSYSTTKPGITRGDHFHTRKVERFSVLKGKARIQLRKINTKDIIEFKLDGANPSFVDMPVWYTHNITNIGESELLTFFWINEAYDPLDPDTFFEKV